MMAKPKVLITRQIPQPGMDILQEFCDLTVWPEELPPTREQLLALARGQEGILTMLSDKADAGLFEAAGPSLKVVANYAVGYDNIDVAEARRRGIRVGNTPGVLTDATADLAFALLMAAARRVSESERYVRAGHWKTWGPLTLLGQDVAGATLGVVGFGRIGQAMARRGTGFGMRILYQSRKPDTTGAAQAIGAEYCDLTTLLEQSDFVSLHVPLTPETRGLIGEAELRRMKPTAILVNTARGAVVDSKALYRALKEGWITAAGLDVTDPEPLPLDDPLLTLDNAVIAPHIGSASVTARAKMAVMAANNILAGLQGQPLPNEVKI